jgi:hypothetical protein
VKHALSVLIVGLGVVVASVSPSAQAAKPAEDRQALVARSKVWFPTDIASMNLRVGPEGPGAFTTGQTVTCEYFEKDMSGRSPKFACRTADGGELKVKYGGENGEVYSEVAASRLLWALGFGADRMYSVRVICKGCPDDVGGIARANGTERILDPAAIERKLDGEELAGDWKWVELDSINADAGGATKAERDALKLLAVILQHSDSKPVQQRIVCVEGQGGGHCATPLMMINDLGIMFGRANLWNQQPRGSMNLAEWKLQPVFKGTSGCIGNLQGSFTGTLKDPVISEEGRQFLAGLLMQLSDQQLHDMFEAARVQLRPRSPGVGRSGFPTVGEWVDAFKAKRTEIVERRCAA